MISLKSHLNVADLSYICLYNCAYYNDIRQNLFVSANEFSDFNNANDCDKFIFLMSHADVVKQIAKACSLMLERRKQYFIR